MPFLYNDNYNKCGFSLIRKYWAREPEGEYLSIVYCLIEPELLTVMMQTIEDETAKIHWNASPFFI